MQFELFAQLGHGAIFSQRCQRTRALNAGLWVRRVRRPDAFFFTIRNSFLPDRPRSSFIPGVSTYSAVQICGATSFVPSPSMKTKRVALYARVSTDQQTSKNQLRELPANAGTGTR